MSDTVNYSVLANAGGNAHVVVSVNNTEVFHSIGVGPDNLSYSPVSGSYTVDGHTLTITITPPDSTTGTLYYKVTGATGYTLNQGVNPVGSTTASGYNWSVTYIGPIPTPIPEGEMFYYLVTISTTYAGHTYTKDNVKLWVCPYGNTTLDDLLTSTFSPSDPLKYIDILKYSDVSGGGYIPEGIRMEDTGEELVPSWFGEAFSYYFGYPTTDRTYWATNGTITFESGASYTVSQLYVVWSDAGLLPILLDLSNFTYAEAYYIAYSYSRTSGICKALNGSTAPYCSPAGINKYRITNNSVLDRWRTIYNTEDAYTDSPTPPTPVPEDDPYQAGGDSTEGGGTGDFDNTSEDVPIPLVPSISVDDTGFISLYNPTLAELRALATYLWSANGLDLDTFKRIFTDPISTILGLTIVPVSPTLASTRTVKLGNVDTGVSMARVDQQYVRHDCGTINVNEYWGGYLDYSPYTSAEIYLPYIGTKPINIDDIMGKSVHVVYTIDLLSGACCALIECGSSVLYQFIGQCACSVPVTGNDMTNLINGILSVVGAGAGAFVATGNVASAIGATVGSLASNVTKSKPHVEKSGSMGSMGGMLGIRSPYLILTRPRQALPAAQNRYTGYPSYISTMMGNLIGYTEMFSVHLGDMPATAEEKAEIEALLKSGVIF